MIECEFEDAKTLPLGHDWKTIADYLKQRGYAVYVSEWHPIIRYGIPHDWRRVFRYPSLQMADDAWGNLLAFKEDPGLEAVANAFSAEMKFRAPAPKPIVSASQVSKTEPSVTENSTISIRQTEGDQLNQNFVESRVPMLKKTPGYESQRIHESAYSVDDASPGNAWYSGFAHQIRRVSPGVFDFLRFLRRSVVHIVRKPFLLAAGLIALAGFIWISFSPALEAQRGWVVMGAVSIALLAGLIYVAHRSQYHAEKLHLKSAKLRRDLASLEGRLANAQILIAHEARGDMVKHVDHVLNASVLPKLESVGHISKDVAELKQEGRQTQNVLDESINRLKEANLRHNQELTKSLEKLSRTLTGVQSSHSDLSANMRNELEALTGKFASGEENLVTLQEKIAELASATSQLDLQNGELRELIEMLEKQNQAEGEKLADLGEQVERELSELKEQNQAEGEKLADLGEQVERELSELKEQIEVHSQATVSLTGGLEQVSQTITETGDLTSQEIKSLAGDLDKLTEQLDERKEHSDAERDALKSQLDEQTQASESISRALAASERWNAYDNTQWFQHFNRKLKQDHIDTLRKDWQKRLSLKLQPQTLGYMAARACDIERQLDGRLATTIEDMLLRTLVARAVKSKSVHVLEIGTLFGTSSAIIFDALKPHFDNIHLSLLDPLDGYYNRAEPDILTGQVVDEETLRRNLSRVGVEDDQITLIKQLSTDPDAIEAAGQQQYDVLVIDGDHSYAGVKADFENYVEFVKLGGYIVFDDYGSPDWPDIKRYVDTELENHPTVTAVGSSWHTSVYRVVKPIARKNEKKTTAG